jgi:hypothetical protein
LVFTLSSEDVGRAVRDAAFFRPAPTEEGATAGGAIPEPMEEVVLPMDGHEGRGH